MDIICTASAIKHIKEQLNKYPDYIGFKIDIRGGGCNGFVIAFEFITTHQKNDIITDCDGINIYIDPKSMIYLKGTKVDYEKTLMRSEFKFLIPNQQGSCGCGSSLYFKEIL